MPNPAFTEVIKEIECRSVKKHYFRRKTIVFKSSCLMNKNGTFNVCGVVGV